MLKDNEKCDIFLFLLITFLTSKLPGIERQILKALFAVSALTTKGFDSKFRRKLSLPLIFLISTDFDSSLHK